MSEQTERVDAALEEITQRAIARIDHAIAETRRRYEPPSIVAWDAVEQARDDVVQAAVALVAVDHTVNDAFWQAYGLFRGAVERMQAVGR